MPSTTTRGAFPYPLPADPNNVPADIQALADRLAAVGALVESGTAAARPAAATAQRGKFYWATDTDVLSYCTQEDVWITIYPVSTSGFANYREAAGAPPAVGTYPEGTIYVNTTTGDIFVSDGTTWRELALATDIPSTAGFMPTAGGTFGGDVSMGGNDFTNFLAANFAEPLAEFTGSGTATLNTITHSGLRISAMTGAVTVATSGASVVEGANGRMAAYLIVIEQNATLRAITWPSVNWLGGSAPTMAANTTYYVVLTRLNTSGTDRWVAQLVGSHTTV